MRLKNSRLSGPRKPWSYPTISLTWLLTAFFVACHASQHLLTYALPEAETAWLALSPAGLQHGFYWQFLTHILTNASIWQLLASVTPFFILGNELEPIVGPRHFFGAFLSTQLPAGAASLLWPPTAGQMGIWPGVCGILAILTTMMPLLEFRGLLFQRPIILRMRVLAVLLPGALILATLAGWITQNSLATLPPAMLLGYGYARWMGYGMPTRLERFYNERRLRKQRWYHLDPQAFIEQEVDPVLEKISHSGWKSLTRQERKILQRSSDTLNKGLS